MRTPPFYNWNDSAVSRPAKVATASSDQDLVDIARGSEADYPSPVRVAGHLHSMNECFATTGTQVFLGGELTTKCEVNGADGTVTVGAGVTMLAIARALRPLGLQLPVMPEIGNATAGSVACCGTKDSSVGAGSGQVSSAVVAVKMVKANGDIDSVGPADAQRLRVIRSSYGLLGMLYEVTFRTEPLVISRYDYEVIKLDPLPTLDRIRTGTYGPPADAVLGFMQPYNKQMLVERRRIAAGAVMTDEDWARVNLRSVTWEYAATKLAKLSAILHVPPGPLGALNRWSGQTFAKTLSGFHASRADCMIEFEKDSPYFDFTFWAFPVGRWSSVVPEYLDFVEQYRVKTGFQASIFTEVYLIEQDDSNALSFSSTDNVFTMDMVDHRPNDPLWRRMNREFNALAIRHGGCPLLNQTKGLTRTMVRKTLGSRWTDFLAIRAADDPNGRFLNKFFAAL